MFLLCVIYFAVGVKEHLRAFGNNARCYCEGDASILKRNKTTIKNVCRKVFEGTGLAGADVNR